MRHAALFLTVLGAALAGCQTPGDAATSARPAPAGLVTLSGNATYRERIALPPDARLTVQISDVSLMDAPAPVIAETRITAKGRQVPLPFSVDYDPARIDPRGRYAVSARITDGGDRLLWITDTHTELPPPGQAVDLLLVRVPG